MTTDRPPPWRWRPPVRESAGYGRVHFWLAPPLQVKRMSCVPLVVLEPGSSRHIPECGFTISPLDAVHCWLAPPLQVHNSIRVLLTYLAPVMSMQPPAMVRVPLLLTVQFCALVLPSQSQICTLVPAVPLPLLSSTHFELLRPDTIVPVAPPEPPEKVV